ncbi:MAG: glycosyltransferase family 39 protein, partial [Solirubrobacteraceae bacterium]
AVPRRGSVEPTPVRFEPTPSRRGRPRLRRPANATAAVLALTTGGLILRLLAGRSFWLDEATSVTQARMPFSAMLTSLRTSDVQPPLHDVLLWVIDRLTGDSETAMRSPSLFAGTALIPLLYWLGRDLWDRRTGLIATGLAAVAPFVVWYSQEARMYAVFMLVASVALWAQVRILRNRDGAQDPWRWRWWLLYSLSTAAMAWTQYFGALVALAQQGAFVVAMIGRRDDRRTLMLPWLASLAVIAVCVAPLVPFVMHQYQVNQAAGRGFGGTPSQTGTDLEAGHTKPTVYAALTNLIWGLWGYHSTPTMSALTALWPAGILLTLALLGRGRSWRVTLLLAFAGLPVAILFVVGQFKPFLFEIRYFCAAVPVAILLLARLCASWPGRRTMASVAMAAILAASFLFAFTDQQFSQTNPRIYDFQGALTRIQQQMRPGDELLYAPQYLNDLVGYYEPHMRSAPLTADPSRVDPHGRVFIMASFQQQPQNARFVRSAIDRLLAAHRTQIGAFRRPQVQVWEFR